MSEPNLPLTGLRVVSLEQAAAAPLCTRRLAIAGAEVIKVERPEGDFARGYDTAVRGQSSYFVWLNAGKKSVVLDLKTDDGRSHLSGIVAQSDVLVQNLKPGALPGLGVDLDQLHVARPEFISVSISGFHPDGPGYARKAYDLLMQAESGLADITGSAHEPGRVGVSIVDATTGMYAYEAVLEGLLGRGVHGKGARIDIALFDAVADLLTVPYLLERYGGSAPERVGLAHPGICPYGVFQSQDGQRLILSIQNEREWQRLCTTALRRDDLLADKRCKDNETRVANRTFVDGAVQEVFSQMKYVDVDKNLHEADLAFAPVHGLAHLKAHTDFHTFKVLSGDADIELPRVPGGRRPEGLVVPELGQHTAEVLGRLESV